MNTALWSVKGNNKARLDDPLDLGHARVRDAVTHLQSSQDNLGRLRGAFRSIPMQPVAGIPIFGLVAASGLLVLVFVVWLVFFDRGGVNGFTSRLGAGGLIGVAVLVGISVALMAFGGYKVSQIVRDLGQMLLIFDNGIAHVRPEATVVYLWPEIKDLRHQSVEFEYGGMPAGTEHAYTVVAADGRELVLLGRSYAAPSEASNDEPLTDVAQAGEFIRRAAAAGS